MYPRHLAPIVLESLADTPVVLIGGARQVGKSTLATTLLPDRRHLTLDDLDTLDAARHDPAGFIAGLPDRTVIDEVQRVPDLLLAVKASVDRDRRPGRFLLTGSANVFASPRVLDSLAGRVAHLHLWPLSQGEIHGSRDAFIDAAFSGDDPPAALPAAPDLAARALAGGYPDVLARDAERRRAAWFQDYLGAIISRDVRDLANIAGLSELPRLLRLAATRAANLLNRSDLARDAGLNVVTLTRYTDLLEATYLMYTLPAWAANVGKRLVKAPKLYFTDTGVLAYLLGVTAESVERDRAPFGAILENFVASELAKQRGWSDARVTMYHYRAHSGAEVDVVLEDAAGRVVGVEVKAAATVTSADFRGLRSLAADAGDRFHRGVVLHAGERTVPFGPRLHAMPVSALWNWGARGAS